MNLPDAFLTTCEWANASGLRSDMVISSRIRLARNLRDYPFISSSEKEERLRIWERVTESGRLMSSFRDSFIYRLSELSEIDQFFMLECHLISREMLNALEGRGVIVNQKKTVSVMVNEEDHLRMQIVLSGLNLTTAWFELNGIDDNFSKMVPFAFDTKLGYLTACPTNVGTGMRASLLMHLPGLVLTKQIRRVFNSLGQLGLTVRGLYGEGSDIKGNLFQISNQITLGRSEMDLMEELERAAQKILESETKARDVMMSNARQHIEDKIWRAYGIMSNARLISSDEVINLSSGVRLGISLGIIKDLSIQQLNELVLNSQPAHLQSIMGEEIDTSERDFFRARQIRKQLREFQQQATTGAN